MRRLFVVALALSLGAAPACSQRKWSQIQTEIATALVSESQERELGRDIKRELERQGATYVTDPRVVGYVEDITARLASEMRRDGATDEIHVHVLDEPRIVNAFATPGGHIYLFSGLLLAAEDEAELAAVIAHELGHLVAEHPARRIALAMGYSTLADLVLGSDPKQLAQIAASLLGGGVLAAHSRGDENEADRIGLRYLHRAGYDPRGLVRFFERLREQSGDLPAVLVWLSTHPTTSSRIERVEALLREQGWEGGEVGADTHRRIQQLVPAPRPREGAS